MADRCTLTSAAVLAAPRAIGGWLAYCICDAYPSGLYNAAGVRGFFIICGGKLLSDGGINLHPLILFAACAASAGTYLCVGWKNLCNVSRHPTMLSRRRSPWHSLPSCASFVLFSASCDLDAAQVYTWHSLVEHRSGRVGRCAIFQLVGGFECFDAFL